MSGVRIKPKRSTSPNDLCERNGGRIVVLLQLLAEDIVLRWLSVRTQPCTGVLCAFQACLLVLMLINSCRAIFCAQIKWSCSFRQ